MVVGNGEHDGEAALWRFQGQMHGNRPFYEGLNAKQFDRQTRWLIRVDGWDHGPFDAPDIRERIRDGRLTLRSEISEERDGRWRTVEDVTAFRTFCKHLVEEARERARVEEINRTESTVRRTHRVAGSLPYIALVVLFGGAGVAAFILTGGPAVQPSNYGSIFYQAELGQITPWARFTGEREHEWRFGSDAPEKSASQSARRKARRRARNERVYEDNSAEDVAVSFDFSDDGAAARQLTDADIHSEVMPKARRALKHCLESEVRQRPDLSEASFRFALLPSGRVAGARVVGAATGRMHACAKRALRGIRIAPFSGSARWVNMSVKVSVQ